MFCLMYNKTIIRLNLALSLNIVPTKVRPTQYYNGKLRRDLFPSPLTLYIFITTNYLP